MIDKSRLEDALVQYKQDFVSKQWGNEKYKWEAVKQFQDNWDVNAEDFPEMLHRSLNKTYNLLDFANNYPRRMIEGFSGSAPEEVRAMFIALYDESKDIYERINEFKQKSANLLEKYGNGAGQHYQGENTISVYLWLRYPDKYYIYKFGIVKDMSEELESDYKFKKGAYADNIRNFLRLYDEIAAELKKDTELVNLLRSQLTDSCYPDPELKTLTIDVGFYINRYYSQKDTEIASEADWFPTDYEPGMSVDDWERLLADETVFTTDSLEIMKRIKDYGGQATCTQLSVKYGKTANFYISASAALAKRIAEKTDCPVMERDNGNARWWTILYVGRSAGKEEEGSYIWKLRNELSAALDQTDLSKIDLYAAAEGEEERVRQFKGYKSPYSSMLIESKNLIFRGAPGTGKSYLAKEIAADIISNGHFNDLASLSDEQRKQVEFVQFHPSYDYSDFVEGLRPKLNDDGSMGFELQDGIFKKFVARARKNYEDSQKSKETIEREISVQESMAEFFAGIELGVDTFKTTNGSEFTITSVDEKHINIFIPGNANIKAISLNVVDIKKMLESGQKFNKAKGITPFLGRSKFTQQSYSYDLAIYKAIKSQKGTVSKPAAKQEKLKKYIFIIDEINRGEISKIFGELFFAIDPGYRGKAGEISTQYANLHSDPDEKFYIPENVYIIGTMNDIDRSVDSFDFAISAE